MNVIKAIYNFIVGDIIILIGTIITLIVLALLRYVPQAQVVSGALLIIAILAILAATLRREANGKR